MDLSIIIVNYNTKDMLDKCIFSILQNAGGVNPQIIVVDNNSQDQSKWMLKQKYPQVKVIANSQNLGFAHANNQGIIHSQAKYILFLNPDTVVLPGALQKSVEFMEKHPEAGVIGCKIYNPDGTLQFSCRSFPNIWNYFCESSFLYKVFPKSKTIGKFYMSFFNYDIIKEVDVVLGAFLLTSKVVLEQIGYFDERYFIYSEETDLCFRVKKSGRKVLFFPEAGIIHYGGASTSVNSMEMIQQEHKSRFLFLRKHYSLFDIWMSEIIILGGVLIRFSLWVFIVGYTAIFEHKKLLKTRNKFLQTTHLLVWYLTFNFLK